MSGPFTENWLLHDISFYECVMIYPFYCGWVFEYFFQFEVIVIHAAMNILEYVFWRAYIHIPVK